MGAIDLLKALFYGSAKPKKKPQNKVQSPSKPSHLKLVPKKPVANQSFDKQQIQMLQSKISKKIQDDPELSKKAAIIIEKMLQKK